MGLLYVYKDGERRGINGSMWADYEADGWSTDPPPKDEDPTLDFGPYDNAKLLHIAAVANVVIEPDASRDRVEELLRSAWEGLGCPPAWLQNAADAPAPVAPEDMDIPAVNDPRPPVEPEDVAPTLFEEDG